VETNKNVGNSFLLLNRAADVVLENDALLFLARHLSTALAEVREVYFWEKRFHDHWLNHSNRRRIESIIESNHQLSNPTHNRISLLDLTDSFELDLGRIDSTRLDSPRNIQLVFIARQFALFQSMPNAPTKPAGADDTAHKEAETAANPILAEEPKAAAAAAEEEEGEEEPINETKEEE